MPCRLKDHAGFLILSKIFFQLHLLRVQCHIRADLCSKFQALFIHIHDVDLPRTSRSECGHDSQANRPSPQNQRSLPCSEGKSFHRMKAYCKRFYQRGLFEAHLVRHLNNVLFRHCHILGKRSRLMGTNKTIMLTKLRLSCAAGRTLAADHQRRANHSFSQSALRYFLSCLYNRPGKFMSQYLRKIMYRTIEESGKIRTANSAVRHLHQNFLIFQFWYLCLT